MEPKMMLTLGLAVMLMALGGSTASAEAACSIGGSGISYNQDGDGAKFRSLAPRGKMNCPSARYVLNRWLRRKFELGYANRLPTRFFDGYVSWRCGKRTSTRWQCDEYTSGTSFRFTAYML